MVHLDADDSDFVASWTIRIVGLGLAMISSAAIAGLAWRVFQWTAG